jgi:hypothetical protein
MRMRIRYPESGIFLALDPGPGWEKFGSGIRDVSTMLPAVVWNQTY